ncbi:trigger factor [Desulfohalobium retbaense]|uniref:Trigger factor n=1 Tax=Desulfohalobium retbaense (strain ATCC 49708 / DSM 5692 / JCM 16813 / HR100) TaxID=485915 RepID=C8X0I2_DESRD|nr:trigger factor [Desulfohalobium retbaense]ACV67807.1 trigger factor [Desulfohalobium retbaense DSM 5692]
MEYQVENISPVEKKITVTVPAEEVNAALGAAIAMYRKDVQIDGFRKGKVPSSIVESKFKSQIYQEATNDLLNVHINQIMGELNLQPLSGLDVDAKEMVRDQDYIYTFSFENVPDIDLPEYKGLSGTKEKVEAKEEDIQEVLDRVRQNMASMEEVDEDRTPKDGEVAVVDFTAEYDGKPVEGGEAQNFDLPLGEGQSLPEFEELVKTLTPGEQAEEDITFPSDFLNKDLADVTVNMKVTLKAIKQRVLPEVDDDFAEKAGGFGSAEEMRKAISESYENSRNQVAKSEAQKAILDKILEQVDFPLPPSMVENQIQAQIKQQRERLERQGKSLESTGTSEEQLREEYRPEAESLVKSHLVLLAIANKEELSVSPQEVEQHLYQMAVQSGQDFQTLKEYHEKNNLMYALRDQLLADKAMELIYDNAEVTEVPAGGSDQESSDEDDSAATENE